VTIWERVYAALSGLGVPLAESVYVPASGEDWPDEYIVFLLVVGTPVQHGDDQEQGREQRVQVTTWKRNGLLGMANTHAAMLAAGFTLVEERELPYSRDTGHYGLSRDYNWYEDI